VSLTHPPVPEAEDGVEAGKRRDRWTPARVIGALKLPALVALVASATTLAYQVFPDLRADPQAQLRGGLRTVAVDRDVSYRDYLTRIGESRDDLLPSQLDVTGNLFSVEAETEGLKRERSELRWYFYDASTGKRMPDQPANPSGWTTRQGTPSDRLIYAVWAPIPTDEGRYRLRFELRAKGVLLAIRNSPPFDYCREPSCGASP
jgi:hypothetical protein